MTELGFLPFRKLGRWMERAGERLSRWAWVRMVGGMTRQERRTLIAGMREVAARRKRPAGDVTPEG